MRRLLIVLAALSSLAGAGCTSTGEGGSDLGSVTSGFSRANDTYGTTRRMDVYGGATAPSLPTIGAPGFGK